MDNNVAVCLLILVLIGMLNDTSQMKLHWTGENKYENKIAFSKNQDLK